jgi:hypothetical protein
MQKQISNQANQAELTSEPEPRSSTSSCGSDFTEELVGDDGAESEPLKKKNVTKENIKKNPNRTSLKALFFIYEYRF